MATNTRKLSDFLAEGEGDTFGDLPVENPHIKPGTLYPAWSGLLEDNTGHTITDSSASGHTITVAGDVHHTGKQKKVGNTTLNFNGGHLNIPDSADWDMAGGEFTVEYWVRGDVTANKMHMGQDGSAGIIRSLVEAQSGTPKIVAYYYGSSAQALISTTTFAANTWYHVAIVRNNSGTDAVNLFINGTQEATIAPNANMANHSAVLSIGAFGTYVDQNHLGYMDEIRITKGLAVYTGNFTPQTTALTTTWSAGTNIAANSTASNVKLLIHSEAGGHSGAYGTAQSDGKKYYYTDIKGSKPIKDPRIGAHFGSQRHKFRSLQILEQETATHGEDVYSIDGRESCRMVNVATTSDMVLNDDHGLRLKNNGQNQDGEFYEIVSYFNDMNVLVKTYADSDHRVKFSLNGAAYGSNVSGLPATVHSPLGGRYVDASSVVNLAVGATLGINTVKINTGTEVYGIELITQDTGSTVRKQHVNIPAQTVVSYGKKFSIGSDTLTNAVHKHHNPFAFKTDGSTAWASGAHNGTSWPVGTGSSHNIDTATSLGLSNWLHSSNYYKPYNGGRVVIWVDSDGTIKTSVTVMPPNAQNVSGSAISAKANASIANNTPVPTFSGTIDHSLSEVAKTFHWTEFGNGAANGGTGASHAAVSYTHLTLPTKA